MPRWTYGVGHSALAAPAGDTDRIALGHACALRDVDLAEVRERDGVAVGLDRDGPARGRDDTGERDDSGRRRAHGLAGGPGDVDAPVLAGGVRVGAERVGAEHVAVAAATSRPTPVGRGRVLRGAPSTNAKRRTTHLLFS